MESGGIAIYGLYRNVLLWGVKFSASAVGDEGYRKKINFGLE